MLYFRSTDAAPGGGYQATYAMLLAQDSDEKAVQTNDKPGSRRLTHLEFRLLYTLMSHRG